MTSTRPRRIVLATGNPGKVREVRARLAGLGLEIVPQAELGVDGAAEPACTFVENALLKARHAAARTGLPALADDSGLEVPALDGQPGVRSARFAGPGASDRENIQALLKSMRPLARAQRAARFHCLLVFLRHARDPTPLICDGAWDGQILDRPRGSGGFGYDPVFLVRDLRRTAAELSPAEKNRLSHRGQALACMAEQLGRLFG